jgi:hypothetical protein
MTAVSPAQRKQSKGPRALGLLEFDTKGNVHLLPVTIMVGKEFYDAGAYKASPVPMAVEPETVYEGVQTGVSKGLFTVIKADKVLGTWAGEGIWDDKPDKPGKKFAPPRPPSDADLDKPPVLKRPGQAAPKDQVPPPVEKKPAENAPAGSDSSKAVVSTTPDDSSFVSDEPVLRRGKPLPTIRQQILAAPSQAWTVARTVPAISDAAGPDPRSFEYDMKPDEQEKIRKQILPLATAEIVARASQLAAATVTGGTPREKASARQAQPLLEDVQLRAFDVSSNNEPVFILSGKARMPKPAVPDVQYFITFVARQDIYGEMHKVFSNLTDDHHLDLIPRYELIDAVDADGDGYADLLFREFSDSGKAFAVYRVIGNQLWPLFEGKP